jgi:hypothetical protein
MRSGCSITSHQLEATFTEVLGVFQHVLSTVEQDLGLSIYVLGSPAAAATNSVAKFSSTARSQKQTDSGANSDASDQEGKIPHFVSAHAYSPDRCRWDRSLVVTVMTNFSYSPMISVTFGLFLGKPRQLPCIFQQLWPYIAPKYMRECASNAELTAQPPNP